MKNETSLEKDFRVMGACNVGHICFLNCHGCYRIDLATPEEKREAAIQEARRIRKGWK